MLPESEAIWLLGALLGKNRSELLLEHQQVIHKRPAKKFRTWIRERARGKPLQYISGRADFWGREFRVGPAVLIPRPETEVLVEIALREGDALEKESGRPLTIVDIGTGSGAIAVTLRKERPNWRVGASDVSAAALKVGRKNARAHGAKITFREGDLLEPWRKAWPASDMIVANLPYVEKGKEWIDPQVAKWEPKLALFPARDRRSRMKNVGAHLAERLVEDCLANESPPRRILLELSARVAYDLERRFHKDSRIARLDRPKDLAGRARFLILHVGDGAWNN